MSTPWCRHLTLVRQISERGRRAEVFGHERDLGGELLERLLDDQRAVARVETVHLVG